jgi:DNA ligase (NAD+)
MKVEIPTNCPECSCTLERVNGQLFCRNDDCSGSAKKKIKHFAKTLKINGVGDATLDKLNLSNVRDLIDIEESYLVSTLGEKVGSKIYDTLIDRMSSLTLATLLESLAIPLIGKVASDKIGKMVSSLDDITEDVCSAAGIGNVATQNLMYWLNDNKEEYSSIPLNKTTTSHDLNITVCVTGKIPGYTRDSISSYLGSLGIKTVSTVSTSVDYLISEDPNSGSTKHKKAIELNIPIISLKDLLIETLK